MADQKIVDQRVLKLALEIVTLLREHPDRYEAVEAWKVSRALFRQDFSFLGRITAPDPSQSQTEDHESLVVEQ